MSKNINNLLPTASGAMLLAVGASHRELRSSGDGGKSKSRSGLGGIHYTGETYGGGEDSYTIGAIPKIREIAKQYENVEGSLCWLHKQEPLRFPYDSVCLGYSEEQDDENFLTIEETRKVMVFLYSIYSNSDLAIATGMSRSRLSNYKRGATRAPIEIMKFVNKHKQSA